MPKVYDIREKDVVSVEIGEEGVNKFKSFIKNMDTDLYYYLKEGCLFNKFIKNVIGTVNKIDYTEKTKTEFADLLITSGNQVGLRIPIQTRYLKLKLRKPKHRRTKIFL